MGWGKLEPDPDGLHETGVAAKPWPLLAEL